MIRVAPLLTVHVADPDGGMRGFVVFHSVWRGTATGGVRAAEDMTVGEVEQLARVMTYKFAFWERPSGGAKAGVVLPPGLSRRERLALFVSFGKHIAPLLRANLYQAWPDLNCGPAEVNAILSAAGLATGPIPDTSYYTALTAFGSLRATAEFLGLSAGACRVAIEGLGRVGTHLARLIEAWGGRLVAVSTVEGAVASDRGLGAEELAAARDRHGDSFVGQAGEWERLPRQDLFATECEIFVPCARVGSVNGATAKLLRARAVVPAANAPCTEEAELALATRGVALLPDFICNSGGVMGTRLTQLGVPARRVRELLVEALGDMVMRLLRQAQEKGASPAALARQVAADCYDEASSQVAEHRGLVGALRRRVERRLPRAYLRREACAAFLRITSSRFGSAHPA